jgi:biofilm regulator BssR
MVKDDRGGTVMSVDRRYRNLMNKLINAHIDLDAYLQLRKAKGYMSVSENDHLRDNLFDLCHEMHQHAPYLQHHVAPEEKEALRLAGGLSLPQRCVC